MSFLIVISILHGYMKTWIAMTTIYSNSYFVPDGFLGAFHILTNIILASVTRNTARVPSPSSGRLINLTKGQAGWPHLCFPLMILPGLPLF